ncbi:MAG: hypothetical protein ACFCVG_05360 [Kineosporiaceae bacterium]
MAGETAATESPREIGDVLEFLDIVELSDVSYHEIGGRRTVGSGEESQSVAVLFAWDPSQVVVRTRLQLHAQDAEYKVDVATFYTLSEPATLTESAQSEFGAKVAVMAAYPYLRSGLFDMATRLRAALPVLGLLRQGQVVLDRVETTTEGSG